MWIQLTPVIFFIHLKKGMKFLDQLSKKHLLKKEMTL